MGMIIIVTVESHLDIDQRVTAQVATESFAQVTKKE